MRNRTLIAGLTAPVIGIIAGLAVLGLMEKGAGDRLINPSWLGGILLFGVPIVYLLEAPCGIPLYRWMQGKNAVTAAPVLLTATVAGILALVLPFAMFAGDVTASVIGLGSLLGGVGGFVTGAWFWIVSGWGRQPQPA